MQGFGPVVVPGGDAAYHEAWEPRVFALWAVSAAERLGTGSGRRIREEMAPEEYLRASYYERWQRSNEQRLLAKGTIDEGEVDAWVERLRAGEPAPSRADPGQIGRVLGVVRTASEALCGPEGARFAAGDRVRVRRMRPSGHTRCPRYVRGAAGIVDAVRGSYPFPDTGPRRGERAAVYSVSFPSTELFGPSDEPAWSVRLDLYEPYLEAA